MKTAQQIEQDKSLLTRKVARNKDGKPRKPPTEKQLAALKPTQWQPGQSGNPDGRPKKDWSNYLSRQVFENNPELAYKAACTQAFSTPYGYQVHAERAYGKLTERQELSGPNGGPIETVGLTDEQLRAEIAELKQRLGFAEGVATMATLGAIEQRAGKTNGETKNHEVLPGNGLLKA